MGRQAEESSNSGSLSITGRLEKGYPTLLGELFLHGQGLFDLGEFDAGKCRVLITLGMVLDQDTECFFVSTIGNKPSRRFSYGSARLLILKFQGRTNEENEAERDQGGCCLHQTGQTPGPVVRHAEGTDRNDRGQSRPCGSQVL